MLTALTTHNVHYCYYYYHYYYSFLQSYCYYYYYYYYYIIIIIIIIIIFFFFFFFFFFIALGTNFPKRVEIKANVGIVTCSDLPQRNSLAKVLS